MAIVQKIQVFNEHRINVFKAIENKLINRKWTKLLMIGIITAFLIAWAFFTVDNNGSINDLDPSWEIGLSTALAQNQWVGRDLFFSYGPLYQLITYASSQINVNNSPYDGNRIARIVIVELSIVLFGICLLLISQLGGLQSLFLYFSMWLAGMFQPMSIRAITGLLAVLVFYKSLTSNNRNTKLMTAVIAGGLAFAAQLLSFEAGIYTIITIFLISLFFLLTSKLNWKLPKLIINNHRLYLEMLGIAIGIYLIANLCISYLYELSASNYPAFFTYQLRSLEIISSFSRTLGSPWINWSWGTVAWFTLIIGTIILGIVCIKSNRVDDVALYVSLLVYSMVMLKSATTRADSLHILYGTFPMFFTLLLLGKPPMEVRKLLIWSLIVTFFAATWLGGNLNNIYFVKELLLGKHSLSLQWNHLRQANNSKLTSRMNQLVMQHPTRPLLAFPYQDYIPALANRTIVAPYLQSYVAGSINMQEEYIDDLEHAFDGFDVIYAIDQLASWEVDGVQSITRTPVIFDYLYRNFELIDSNSIVDGFLLLDHRTKPKDIKGYLLSFSTTEYKGKVSVTSSQPELCSLIKLTIQIKYPISIILGHASPVHMTVFLGSDKVVETNVVDLNNGEPFDTYISLIPPDGYIQLFDNTNVTQVMWDRFVIAEPDARLFGINPQAVLINTVECISPLETDG